MDKIFKDTWHNPRKCAFAMFRLITGHDCLSKHGVLPSSNCLLCSKQEEMKLEHLLNCEELKLIEHVTSKYWEARRRMTSLLNSEHYIHTQINMEGGQSGTYLRLTRASSGLRVSVTKTYRDETKRKWIFRPDHSGLPQHLRSLAPVMKWWWMIVMAKWYSGTLWA